MNNAIKMTTGEALEIIKSYGKQNDIPSLLETLEAMDIDDSLMHKEFVAYTIVMEDIARMV